MEDILPYVTFTEENALAWDVLDFTRDEEGRKRIGLEVSVDSPVIFVDGMGDIYFFTPLGKNTFSGYSYMADDRGKYKFMDAEYSAASIEEHERYYGKWKEGLRGTVGIFHESMEHELEAVAKRLGRKAEKIFLGDYLDSLVYSGIVAKRLEAEDRGRRRDQNVREVLRSLPAPEFLYRAHNPLLIQ